MGLDLSLTLGSTRPGGAAPDVQPHRFTLTAADFSGVIVGYQPGFEVGSISREPLDANTLEFFYSRTDTSKTVIQFDGLCATLMAGIVPVIDGVPVVWETDWTEDSGKTAAQADGVLIAAGARSITWQAGG